MKLDNSVLNLLLDREPVRFITQPDKYGFSKAVVVSPLSHVYALGRVSSFKPCSSITNNNVILDGVNKEYKLIMAYLSTNQYEII